MAYAAMEGEHTGPGRHRPGLQRHAHGQGAAQGLSAETLELVEEALRGREPGSSDLSAAEAASLLGISRVSARRYLEHLTEQGKAR